MSDLRYMSSSIDLVTERIRHVDITRITQGKTCLYRQKKTQVAAVPPVEPQSFIYRQGYNCNIAMTQHPSLNTLSHQISTTTNTSPKCSNVGANKQKFTKLHHGNRTE